MASNKLRCFSALLAASMMLLFFCSCGRDLSGDDIKVNAALSSPAPSQVEPGTTIAAHTAAFDPVEEEPMEFRGFWLSYAEIGRLYCADSAQFYQTLHQRFSYLADRGFRTVFFHVRAFSDAFYASTYFPWTSYLTGTQGVAPGYDPLAVAIRAAHDAGLELHAWINPYRVSYQTDITLLSTDNPARRMYEDASQAGNLLLVESGIYYNPASVAVQKLIIDGVRELIGAYDIDGVHIDDYFYPTDVGNADDGFYNAYLQSGGTLSRSDWRIANVNSLVAGLYSAVKTANPAMPFGVSPGGIRSHNYETCYADVERWCADPGYCDYIVPQIYFGFRNNYAYDEMLDYWTSICTGSTKLYIGLALYKSGERDRYAGSPEGETEWQENTDMIKRQIEMLRQNEKCRGFVIFSFSDFFDETNPVKASELSELYAILNGD